MIAHLCVAESHRGTGVAKRLFDGVKDYAQKHELRGVGLYCRRNYPAYTMWPKLGFAPIASKRGRGADGADLTYWWHDLHAQDLFTQAEEIDERLGVVIDCNVFRDLHDTSEKRNEEAKYLLADWITGHIELCVVNELFIEIDRIPLPCLRESLRRDASRYRRLEYESERTNTFYEEIKAIFGCPKPTPQRESDMRQVAMSVAANAEMFITRDEEIHEHAHEIGERYNLQIMRPVDLISQLHETEQAAIYQPARFASTDIQKTRPRPEDVDTLAEKLHVPSIGESRVQFVAKLRAILSDARRNTLMAANLNTVPLFLVAHSSMSTRCEISMLRCDRTALASTSLRHALLNIIAAAAKSGNSHIVIQEKHLSKEVLVILHELGFRIGPTGWEKITLRYLGDMFGLNQALHDIKQPMLPEDALATEIEAQYWPAKVIGAGVTTWAVAIQPGWATELFETTFANELLIRPKRELILSRENVYYSAAVQSGMAGASGRVLWYVSQNPDQAGTQTIRACSRLLEVRRGPAKKLFNEFRRLGVFEWRDIWEIAGRNPNKDIIALRFADTELFEHPFPGAQAKELGIRNNFTSPVKVPENAFIEIYRQGMGLSVSS